MTSRRPRRIDRVARGVLAVALLVGIVVASSAQAAPGRAPDPPAKSKSRARSSAPPASAPAAPTAPADPVREAYARAAVPALGDSSRTHLSAFIARYPRHPLAREAWLELGTLSYALGEYAEARDAFRHARGGAVADRARLWEARALLALGAPSDARALVQAMSRARAATPERWEANEIVALSWTNEGKRSNALATYRSLLAGPDGADEAAALYQAIELADEANATADGRAWRERLQRTFPRSPEAASVRAEATSAAEAAEARVESDDDGSGGDDAKRGEAKRGDAKSGARDARSKP